MRSFTLNFADWLEAIFWHSFWHIFWHSFWHAWGTHNNECAWSQLRSGTQHWPPMIAVEVWHATLTSHDRGWGPARHTELTRSRLRSGTPHWTHTIAVEVRHATLNSHGRKRRTMSWTTFNHPVWTTSLCIPLPFCSELYPSTIYIVWTASLYHLVWTASLYHLVWTAPAIWSELRRLTIWSELSPFTIWPALQMYI